MRLLYLFARLAGTALIVSAAAPFIGRMKTKSFFLQAFAGVLVFFTPELSNFIKYNIPSFHRVILCAYFIVLTVAAVFVAAVSVLMQRAAAKPCEDGLTLILLGAGAHNGTPGKLTEGRLHAAAIYLTRNPGSAVICTGYANAGEIITEAAVMKEYLIKSGISEGRIITEETASSTNENFLFSARLISSGKVAVATDPFHQFRASVFARRAGLETCPVNASTVFYAIPAFWLREIMGVAHLMVFGK